MRPDTKTAAHRTLPFGTQVTVLNRRNGRTAVVRISVFMAQEISERAKREAEFSAERCGSPTVECDDGHSTLVGET
jgi:hypothetical protein